jgi:hypoxanthine-DNA glycosylase
MNTPKQKAPFLCDQSDLVNKGSSRLYQPMRIVKRVALAWTMWASSVEEKERVALREGKGSEHFSSLINPRNQFWKLVGALVEEDLYGMPYDERLPRLLAHRFGLWDVLAACEREGSLDSAIRKPAANDFDRLRHLCPELETVGFNGQASGKFATQFEQAGYRTVVLPSSSPAHMALSFEQKLAVWRKLVDANLDTGSTAQLF